MIHNGKQIPQSVLDKHRDINVDQNWWDNTYSSFIDEMKEKFVPLEVENISFSGFCSQGDGASFTCRIDEVAEFMEAFSLHEKFPRTFALAKADNSMVEIGMVRNSHRYVHSYSVGAEVTAEPWSHVQDPANGLMEDFYEMWDTEIQNESEGLRQEVEGVLRAEMNRLYRMLEEEYEYLTSDEQVVEALEINEMLEEELDEFDEELV